MVCPLTSVWVVLGRCFRLCFPMGCWVLDFLLMQHGGCCDGAQHYQAIAGGYRELESSCCLHCWSVYRKRGFCHSRPSIRNQWVQFCPRRISWLPASVKEASRFNWQLIPIDDSVVFWEWMIRVVWCLLQIRWWRLLRTLGGFSWYVLLNVLNCLWDWSFYRF